MSADTAQNTDDPAAYRTVAGLGSAEIKIEGSRFLGRAHPISSEEEALELVDELRAEHHAARHVCYGLRVGHGASRIDRSNDDGEPARTGGFPIWQLLSGEELENSLIVVVRYYGGTKLGMGGLKRAYRDAAKAALEAAGTVVCHPETTLQITVPYPRYDELERLIKDLDSARITAREFGADVDVELAIWTSNTDEIRRRIGDLLGRDPNSLGETDGQSQP